MHVVAEEPLPDFAQDFGARSWAQFLLKRVIAHPAATSVLCGTSNPDHMSDNLMAMRGPPPDEPMCRRMVRHMEAIPGFSTIGSLPWYPGKDALCRGQIRSAQAAARTATLR